MCHNPDHASFVVFVIHWPMMLW